MNSAMLGLLAETSIHPGAGRSLGVVDLPVAREAGTGYPVIVGSSLKGSLRDAAEDRRMADGDGLDQIFGKPDRAGDVLVSDARLLLLPVRSLARAYRWVTCPYLIERFRRDLLRAGIEPQPPRTTVAEGTALAGTCQSTGEGNGKARGKADGGNGAAGAETHVFLEERVFEVTGAPDPGLVAALRPLMRHQEAQERLDGQLVVLHDDDFAWFCQVGLPVQARNQLEDGTKKSQNLWYEESLPPDTIMYSLLLSRQGQSLATVRDFFERDWYLQVGGNATVGQGWFAVTVRAGGAR